MYHNGIPVFIPTVIESWHLGVATVKCLKLSLFLFQVLLAYFCLHRINVLSLFDFIAKLS